MRPRRICSSRRTRIGQHTRMERRRGWRDVVLACGVIVLTVAVLDRFVAWSDLGYRAARGRPNDDRRLTRPEFDVRVVTNALGFREPRLPAPKPAGVARVVALGDSFTQGYGVDAAQSYPRLLEARLTAARGHEVGVINLGVPGTSPRDYVGHLADPGLAYAPDLVLIGVMSNDVQDVWIQRRFGVRFVSELLREVQRDAIDDRPLWRRAPALVLPALYPFVWERVGDVRQAFAAHLGPGPAVASPTPAPVRTSALVPHERWREVALSMCDRFGHEAIAEQAIERASPERQ